MGKSVEQGGHRPSVLIVDDERDLRAMLSTGLGEFGYEVLEADCVESAQQQLRDHGRIDVVVSDVRMPGGADGMDLAIWLYRFRPETILILTSGYFQQAEAEAGPMVYGHRLPKPFRPSEAAQLIEQCLAKRAGERARLENLHHGHWE